MRIDICEAEAQRCKLGELVWQGEEAVIARDGEPYLHLVPYRGAAKPCQPGDLKGRIWMAPDFDETPQEVIDAFGGTFSNDLA